MKSKNLIFKIFAGCTLIVLTSACAKLNFTPVAGTAIDENLSAAVPTPATRTISKTEFVAFGNKQVDFLLVLDDSNSMMPELKKLASRMSSFVASLEASSIDWQMCLTTTRGLVDSRGNVIYGSLLAWKGYTPNPGTPAYLLRRNSSNLNSIFTSTVNSLVIGGGSSGDERAIKATHDNFSSKSNHNCYRAGAAISIITISDEDERSVGGQIQNMKPNDSASVYQPLEPTDLPEVMIAKAKLLFGEKVRLTFNSIIVKPGDSHCESIQDLDTSPSHHGNIYAEASRMTEGGIGSICESDYAGSLNTFKDKIVNSLTNLTLECTAAPESLEISSDGTPILGAVLQGKVLKFLYPLVEGTNINLKYNCID